MKKVISILLVVLMLTCVLVSCAPSAKDDKTFKIGICNWVDDASLNQIDANIEATLKAAQAKYDVKFEIDYKNCLGDTNLLTQIIANFISNKVDLMIGIATPVAIAMQTATEDNEIPVIFAAVSDPVSAGLVESLENPGANISGTSDYLNTEALLNLIFAVKPDAKVGLLYDMGQDSSTTAIKSAKAYLTTRGKSFIEKTGVTIDELSLAVDSLIASNVDAIFTPTDNTVMTAELSIYEKIANAGVAHYAGADSFALNGAFVGYGVDYANLGVETANMVIDVLVNKKDISSLKVKTFDNGLVTINTDICTKLGYNFDEISNLFKPYCTKINTIKTAEDFEK